MSSHSTTRGPSAVMPGFKLHQLMLLAFGLFASSLMPPNILSQTCTDSTIHFSFTSNTGDDYAIVISENDSACSLQLCDEVAVFDGELCVGASVFDGSWPIPIVAWRDDIQTPDKDGFMLGERMSFRIWRAGDGIEESAILHSTFGNGTFGDGAYLQVWLECPDRCCERLTGNVNNDPADFVDIGDLTDLIWFLFLEGPLPACPAEANIDGDVSGIIDIGDLTALIDYLFITFTPPAECR